MDGRADDATTEGAGGFQTTVNLDTRWERLREWLRDLAHDPEESGRIDETDVLLKMRELDEASR